MNRPGTERFIMVFQAMLAQMDESLLTLPLWMLH